MGKCKRGRKLEEKSEKRNVRRRKITKKKG
jgi:hypothetical protein